MAVGVTALPPVDAGWSDTDSAGRAGHYRRATLLLAEFAVVVAGVDLEITRGVSAALLVALVLLPLWVVPVRRFEFTVTVVALSVLAVAAGWLLSEQAAVDHTVSAVLRVQAFGLLLSGTAVFVLVIWARSLLPTHRIVVLYGLGALGAAFAQGQTSWKYHLALPTTLVILGLLEGSGRRLAAAVAVLVLGVIGVLDDGRSYFAICVLASLLTLWQLRPRNLDRRTSRWLPAVFMAVIAVVVYLLATALLTGGYLGAEAQTRSNVQIATSGSLLVGGRPEWTATKELVTLRPLGYGAGVVPAWEDVRAGQAGLQSVNVELESTREAYMFGGQFKLHSVAADLWVSYGLVGVALAAVMLFAILRSMVSSVAESELDTSVALVAILAVWFLLFGPIYTNWVDVCVGVALVVLPVGLRRPVPA